MLSMLLHAGFSTGGFLGEYWWQMELHSGSYENEMS